MRCFVLRSAIVLALGIAAAGAAPAPASNPNDRVAALVADIQSNDAKAQEHGFLTLIEMGPKAAGAVPALIEKLDDPRSLTRDFTITALGGIGAAAAPALPKLEQVAKSDPDTNIRGLAHSAIGTIRAASRAPEAPAPSPAPNRVPTPAPLIPNPNVRPTPTPTPTPAPAPAPAPAPRPPGMTIFSRLGTFADGPLSIEIHADGDRYFGNITLDGRVFPFTGSVKGITLTGQFKTEDGDAFDFTALYDVQSDPNGSILKLTSDGKTHALKRTTPQLTPENFPTAPAPGPTSAPGQGAAPASARWDDAQATAAFSALITVIRDPSKGLDAGGQACDSFFRGVDSINNMAQEMAVLESTVKPIANVIKSDPNPVNRVKAAMYLGKLSVMADPALPDMIGLLKDQATVSAPSSRDGQPQQIPVRALAAVQLANLELAARDALPALRELAATDPDQNVRKIAGDAIARIEKPQ